MNSVAKVDFRTASAADVDLLVNLEVRFYAGENYPFDAAEARTLLVRLLHEPQRGRVFVAVRGSELVGYLILTFCYSMEFHGINAIVDELYIQPDARGLGLGKRALALAETTCIEMGIRALHLEVERRNTTAQELYRSRGFKDHDRYLMTKFLPVGESK
jgi:ribosomal protein S18 acetylase RimI-like enzyme